MPKYQRMTPTKFGQWVRNNLKVGKCVNFALCENDGEISDEEALAKGEVYLSDWWFAAIVEFPEYGTKMLIINRVGGGAPYAVEVNDNMEEILESYFFDDIFGLVVETEEDNVTVEVNIEDDEGRIIEYETRGSSVEEAKKESLRRIDETCLSKHCKVGEVTISVSIIGSSGEYIDSEEVSANWDGKRVKFYEDL